MLAAGRRDRGCLAQPCSGRAYLRLSANPSCPRSSGSRSTGETTPRPIAFIRSPCSSPVVAVLRARRCELGWISFANAFSSAPSNLPWLNDLPAVNCQPFLTGQLRQGLRLVLPGSILSHSERLRMLSEPDKTAHLRWFSTKQCARFGAQRHEGRRRQDKWGLLLCAAVHPVSSSVCVSARCYFWLAVRMPKSAAERAARYHSSVRSIAPKGGVGSRSM